MNKTHPALKFKSNVFISSIIPSIIPLTLTIESVYSILLVQFKSFRLFNKKGIPSVSSIKQKQHHDIVTSWHLVSIRLIRDWRIFISIIHSFRHHPFKLPPGGFQYYSGFSACLHSIWTSWIRIQLQKNLSCGAFWKKNPKLIILYLILQSEFLGLLEDLFR